LKPSISSPDIALGLNEPVAAGAPRSLRQFADKTLSFDHNQWKTVFGNAASGNSFSEIFTNVVNNVVNSKGVIKFDLTNLNLSRVVKDIGLSAEKASSYTNWEFNQIMENPSFLKSTNFYENGIRKSTESVVKDFQNAIKQTAKTTN
jgi:hypothetical protein